MPWRHDFVQCFWVDPDWGGFSGYPEDLPSSRTPPGPTGPPHVRSKDVTHTATLDETERPIGAAVVFVRLQFYRPAGPEPTTGTRHPSPAGAMAVPRGRVRSRR